MMHDGNVRFFRLTRPDEGGDPAAERALVSAAARHGFMLHSIAVDDLVITQTDETVTVVIGGEALDPAGCVFHTGLPREPAEPSHMWQLLTTAGILESAGFCVTVPPAVGLDHADTSIVLSRFHDETVGAVPTVRLCTREIEVHGHRFEPGDWGLDYPLVVKPAGWQGSEGVFVTESRRRLTTVLQLAGASEQTVVIQPWLGPDAAKVRVHCVDGEPAPGADPKLTDAARRISCGVGLPYVRIDFLAVGDRFWLSDVDVAGLRPDADAADLDLQIGAYREYYDRFVETGDRLSWRYSTAG